MDKMDKKEFAAPEIYELPELEQNTASDNLLNKLYQFCQKTIKKPYYYVSPCPNCGSPITGRYAHAHYGESNDWVINEALRNGEIIDIVPEVGFKNCFCMSCGYEWFDFVDMRWFSLEQIQREKTLRHTRDFLSERYKENKEYEKTHKKNFLMRYIGKL